MQSGTRPKSQPFGDHVLELRRRIFYVVAALLVSSSVGFLIQQRLFAILRHPLNAELYYTNPTGGFNAVIRVSILFGIVVTVPVIIYNLVRFLAPALRKPMKIMPIIALSILLALMGISFAYFISLPAALHFLANLDAKDLQSLITVNEYLSFVTGYISGFALLFQMPLIMLLINRIKPQKPGRLLGIQRYIVLISFIAAAVLTPTPDPINQTIMALPIILLYQVSVGMIWFINRKNNVVYHKPVKIDVAYTTHSELPEVVHVSRTRTLPFLSYSKLVNIQPLEDKLDEEARSAADRLMPWVDRVTAQPKKIMDVLWSPQNSIS